MKVLFHGVFCQSGWKQKLELTFTGPERNSKADGPSISPKWQKKNDCAPPLIQEEKLSVTHGGVSFGTD